jgi:ATP-dependent exoDNAse (exonuclease V) beta subunit
VGGGLAATEIGDAVHRLLELIDPAAPVAPELDPVRAWYPSVSADELERIGGYVTAYCSSTLAQRLARLEGVRPERPFAFEHDGVLLHGRLDLLQRAGGRAIVVDYKTNVLGERTPEEIVEHGYRLQRLVYALACLKAGVEEVEVVYTFLERPEETVTSTFTTADVPTLEAELSAAIGRIAAGVFVPRPSDFTCSGCPALDVVCAGPRLRGGPVADPPAEYAAA